MSVTTLESKLKAEAAQLVDNINGLINAGASDSAGDLAYRYIRNASVSDVLAKKFSVGYGLLEGYIGLDPKEKVITLSQVDAIFNEYIENLENKFDSIGPKGKRLIEEAKTTYSAKKAELAEHLLYAAAEALNEGDSASVKEKLALASELANTEIYNLITKAQNKCAEQGSQIANQDAAKVMAAKYLQLNLLLDYANCGEASQ